jgi:hypothetical protein
MCAMIWVFGLQEYTIVCRNKQRTRYADGSQLGMHANEKHLSHMEHVCRRSKSLRFMASFRSDLGAKAFVTKRSGRKFTKEHLLL